MDRTSRTRFSENAFYPKLDELIDKVPVTKDPAEKKRLALEAALMAQQEYNSLRIARVNSNVGVSAKVSEVPLDTYIAPNQGWSEMLKHVK